MVGKRCNPTTILILSRCPQIAMKQDCPQQTGEEKVIISRYNKVTFNILKRTVYLFTSKSLRLSKVAIRKTSVGQMVNMLSNDVHKFDESMVFISFLFIGPLQTICVGLALWQFLGYASVAGLASILLYVPFHAVMGKIFLKFRSSMTALTDDRIRLMNEIILGIRVIKSYVWEAHFVDRIADIRQLEISMFKVTSQLKGLIVALYYLSTPFTLFASFLSFVLLYPNTVLTAEIVFVSMTLFNKLRLSTTLYLPKGIVTGAETIISLQRVQKFLLLEEQEFMFKPEIRPALDQCGIWFESVTARWNYEVAEPTLASITTSIEPGELLVIVGTVGSGKSSILMSVLGELPILDGAIKVCGKVAYSSQDPWVFAGSVQQNILFGQEFDEKKYRRVVHACALDKDIRLFPFGDRTLVGETGMSLSGGQKARINLARAIYFDADVYLMDDPLSAVDSTVANHLFEQCINGYLKSKVRVLVTHQLQFLKEATKIIVLEKEMKHPINVNQDKGNVPELPEEEKNRGSVSLYLYWRYMRAGAGCCILFLLISSNFLTQTLYSGADFWLKMWTNAMGNSAPEDMALKPRNASNGSLVETNLMVDRWFYVYVYTGMTIGVSLLSICRSVAFYIMCMEASVNLHKQMFSKILHAPVSFFDENPSGRILNRFSADMGIIDDLLPTTTIEVIVTFLSSLGILIVISIINQYLIIPTVLLVCFFYKLRQFYLHSALDVKRLEGIARSPVFSQISTTLYGLTTIRAFRAQTIFEDQFYNHQNNYTRASFMNICINRWIGIILDSLSIFYVAVVTVFLLLLPTEDEAGGNVGLTISSALLLCGVFQLAVRQSADMESQMTSVERVFNYSKLECEKEFKSSAKSCPPSDWPQKGEITFDNMSLSYSPTKPPVLKNFCCHIRPKEKIGIVGRTGAGKSSIVSALFRTTEPVGHVIIDGIITKDIGLHDLRKKITVIPQEPVLFTGTVRQNIDPFGRNNDKQLWSILCEVQLKKMVENFPGGLDECLTEGGKNISVGERQLICMARAILQDNRILVLDEATANVDTKTDKIIQKILNEKFQNCTVFTIAHRLNTIMDCDRVMVLDAGQIKEFDEPHHLLQNDDGVFTHMVKNTGQVMADQLKIFALEAYQFRHRKRLPYFSRSLSSKPITANELTKTLPVP